MTRLTLRTIVFVTAVLAIIGGLLIAWHFRTLVAHPHTAIVAMADAQAKAPVSFAIAFFFVDLVVTAFCIPIEIVFAVAAGALFGLVEGVVLVSFASVSGASMAFLGSRFLLRETVKRHFAPQLGRIDQGIARDGPFYLLSLRLLPAIPFPLVNILLGMTGMRLRTFFWVSQLGMLPALVLYVNAGTQLARIKDFSSLMSPGVIAALIALAVFPWVIKSALAMWRRNIGRPGGTDG